MFRLALALSCWIALASGPAQAVDTVHLKNGDRLSGQLVKKETDVLVLRTPYAGEIEIRFADIDSLHTTRPVEVMLSDQTRMKAIIRPADDGQVILKAGDIIETAPLDLQKIAYINPSPEISGKGVKFSGRATVGLNVTSGNSDTQNLYVDAELVARTKKNRYTVGFQANRQEEDGNQTADKATLYSKYDHFVSDRWYLYANTAFTRDEFRDLNLRSTAGFGVGHQIFESEQQNLSLEGGVSYVNEDYIDADDDNYMALRWGVHYDRFFWAKRIQLFHDHEGLLGLEDTDDLLIRSQTGLRFPLSDRFSTALQLNADWDNTPAPGTESTDLTYLFNLGYTW